MSGSAMRLTRSQTNALVPFRWNIMWPKKPASRKKIAMRKLCVANAAQAIGQLRCESMMSQAW